MTRSPDSRLTSSPNSPSLPHPITRFFKQHSHMSCSQQRGLVVQHHAHRNLLQQRTQAPFIAESIDKAAIFQFGKNLRGYAAADIYAAGGKELKCQVPCGCTVDVDEEIDRLLAQRTLARQAALRHHG